MHINFLYNSSDNKAFIMFEEYIMVRKLLKRLNSKESSLNFKKAFSDGILETKSYFHLRFTLPLKSRAMKAKPNN